MSRTLLFLYKIYTPRRRRASLEFREIGLPWSTPDGRRVVAVLTTREQNDLITGRGRH